LSPAVFRLFAVVPLLYRSQVSDHPGVNFGFTVAVGTAGLLAGEIAVGRTDRKGGRQGEIGQMVIVRNFADQRFDGFDVADLLSQKQVQYGAAGVFGLQVVLEHQGFENIVGMVHRQLGGVGVIGDGALLTSSSLAQGYPDSVFCRSWPGGTRCLRPGWLPG
jgi:hypothetical protein